MRIKVEERVDEASLLWIRKSEELLLRKAVEHAAEATADSPPYYHRYDRHVKGAASEY